MGAAEREGQGLTPMISNLKAGSRNNSFCSGVVCDCKVFKNMERCRPYEAGISRDNRSVSCRSETRNERKKRIVERT